MRAIFDGKERPTSERPPDPKSLFRAPVPSRRPGAHATGSAWRRGHKRPRGAPPRQSFYLQPLELSALVLFPSSALPWSVRQALSSVGSHLRVNIISDGHNRLE